MYASETYCFFSLFVCFLAVQGTLQKKKRKKESSLLLVGNLQLAKGPAQSHPRPLSLLRPMGNVTAQQSTARVEVER